MEDKLQQSVARIRHQQSISQMAAVERSVAISMKKLGEYLAGRTTKTEVVNQLKEIGTPDALKVIPHIEDLHKTLKTHKNTDLSEVTKLLKAIAAKAAPEVKIPKPLDTVKVSNLKDIDFTTLEKAVKDIKLSPVIKVASPEVKVEQTDLSPLKTGLLQVVNAVKAIKPVEIPITDLSTLEKASELTNKHLEAHGKKLDDLVKKPTGGGGGGSGVSYQEADGKPVRVELEDGRVPVALPSDGGGLTDEELRAEAVEVHDPTTEGILAELSTALTNLSTLTEAKGIAADLRVTLIGGTTAVTGTLTGVTTVTTVSTVSNQTSSGGYRLDLQVMNQLDTAVNTGIRNNINVS